MYYLDPKLQYPVRVDKPNPVFAKMLQQAIGGVEGEIRVYLQYFFQGWANEVRRSIETCCCKPEPRKSGISKCWPPLLRGISKAPVSMQETAAQDGVVNAILGGMNPRHYLSAGLAATPENSNGVPFNCSHVYASGNIAGDMLANVTAEATGRTLACRLYEMTDDTGTKDMLSFLIARDTMHQ